MRNPHTAARVRRPSATRPRTIRASTLCVAFLAAAPLAAPAASLVEYTLLAVSQDDVVSPDAGAFQVPLNSVFFETATSGGARASAGYAAGVARVSADATWAAGPTNQTGASASIGIFDSFTLAAPPGSNLTGAFLSFSMALSGSLTASNGAALWFASGELSAPAYRDANFMIVIPRITIGANGRRDATTGSMGTALPVTLTSAAGAPGTTNAFNFGVPIDLRVTLRAAIDAQGSGSGGSASANLSDTIVWLGITARDSQGAVIEGLQITSASGQNWLEPAVVVPLPPTAWLLLTSVGALGLGGLRGARRGGSRPG